MITIFGFDIQLPGNFSILAGSLASFVATLLVAIIFAILLQVAIFRFVKFLLRKNKTDLYDVILGILRIPLIVFIILFGIKDSVDALGITKVSQNVDKIFWAAFAICSTYLIYRIFREVLVPYWQGRVDESESSVDDILLPLVKIIAPIIIFVVGVLVSLQVLGLNISALAVIIGGGSFILAFALQATLTNIFSGISLIMDTPFKIDDIIVLSDNRICQVKHIGLRITELYNTADHSTIFMPNSKMAEEMLINMTRPTPDLKSSIIVGVEQTSDALKRTPDLLLEIARANPYVLGDGKSNLEAMKARKEYIKERITSGEYSRLHYDRELKEIEWGMKMVKDQSDLYADIERLCSELKNLSSFISEAEKSDLSVVSVSPKTKRGKSGAENGRGLSADEKRQIVERFGRIKQQFDEMLSGKFEAWVDVRGNDPSLRGKDKEHNIQKDADHRKKMINKHLEELKQRITHPSEADEWRLDTYLMEFREWIEESFLDTVNDWQLPVVSFEFGDYTYNLKLSFFVDDIHLEKFARLNRVPSDLKRRITERLYEEEIAMPNPTQIINLDGGPEKFRKN